MKQLLLTAAALAALSACTVNTTDENNADMAANASGAVTGDVETLPADDSAGAPENSGDIGSDAGNGSDNGATPTPPPATSASIPAQYQGRWGMVPADCTSTRGDAKGLIAIDSKTIKFYESRATLKEQRPAIATSFSGLFGFMGEGQTWEKVVTLTRTGNTLKRADNEGSYTYTRCA